MYFISHLTSWSCSVYLLPKVLKPVRRHNCRYLLYPSLSPLHALVESFMLVFFFFNIYLFISFLAASGLTCGMRDLFYFLFYLFTFWAALGLRCCALAFSSCGERGLLFIAVRGLLIVVASLVAEHGL